MILQALNRYYERLAADPEQEVPPYGYSIQKISFCVVLEPDGTLHSVQDLRRQEHHRALPVAQVVPHPGGKRTSAVTPYFLWDKTGYVFGRDAEAEDKGGPGRRKRLQQQFEAFRDRHLSLKDSLDCPQYAAVCQFLSRWDPAEAESLPHWQEMSGKNVVFSIRGQDRYVHDIHEVRAAWLAELDRQEDAAVGRCLVTNEQAPLARTHLPVKGVIDPGGQAEKSIVSFNLDAFTSYGKTQSYNAPISERAAFQYATALNHLLDDPTRRIQIADATTVFWTERPTPAERYMPTLFGASPRASPDAEDAEILARLGAFLDRLRQGKADARADELGDPETQFYVLGLSPNASRISVRYWFVSTVGQLIARLARHLHDLEVVGLGDRSPTLHELLGETAPPKNGWADKSKIPKLLAGGLVRAVLTDRPYPAAFYAAILRRIQAEQFAVPEKRKDWRKAMARRAAAVKACLVRNFGKEMPVSLDPTRPEPAYQLGRWFALLEKVQRDALGESLNTTIKNSFYTAASATPAAVFPRLIQGSQHHINRIDSRGLRVTREKQIQEIASRLDAFPRRLNPEEQGLFHLGYYHQTQNLYTSKATADAAETPAGEKE